MSKTKAITIDDKNITYIKLLPGKYLIDGNLVNVEGVEGWPAQRVQCKDPNDIHLVTINKYIKEYRCGDKVMSVEDYKDSLEKLAAECIKYTNKYDDYTEYNSLEDEFKYRKFITSWTPIYATEEVISDGIAVEIEHIKYDTGNKFVRSAFLNGLGKDDTLYSYYQNEAWPEIVRECFDSLGMEYANKCGYSATANKKIWGNSDHSCIEFVVAFGKYIMPDYYKTPHTLTGTLDDMLERYNKDKEALCNIIKTKYNEHFGCIDAGVFDFDKLLKILRIAKADFAATKPTQKTADCFYNGERSVNKAIEMIEAAYTEKKR